MRRLWATIVLLIAGCSSGNFQVASSGDDSSTSGDTTTSGDTATGSDTSTGSDTDVRDTFDGPVPCPAPASAYKPPDMSGKTCAQLSADWLTEIEKAKSCGCDLDCTAKVCETLCCNCEVYVSPRNDAYRTLSAIKAAWDTNKCSMPCPGSVCPPASSGGCHGTTATAPTFCKTTRG